jgi:hypothetical protein
VVLLTSAIRQPRDTGWLEKADIVAVRRNDGTFRILKDRYGDAREWLPRGTDMDR